MIFTVLVFLAALLAGGVAAISGFGIGSLLTPLFAVQFGAKLAVAIVSVPHLFAAAARFISLRKKLDTTIFLHFGILSAVGGLIGALLNARANSPALAIVFGCLLVFAAASGLTGFIDRMRFGRRTVWVAGALSGFFGGLVGNQGGIRSAALLGLQIQRETLVATATAIALIVDGARMPVYMAAEGRDVLGAWPLLVTAALGALLGTFWGVRLLRRIPEPLFRKLLYILILALGIYMLIHGVKLREA